jgi:hypothetical protein
MLELGLHVYNLAQNQAKKFFPEGDVQIIALNKKVTEQVVLDQIYSNVKLCLIAGAVILTYVILHVKSVFLGSIAMLNIGMSIPIGIVIYCMIC